MCVRYELYGQAIEWVIWLCFVFFICSLEINNHVLFMYNLMEESLSKRFLKSPFLQLFLTDLVAFDQFQSIYFTIFPRKIITGQQLSIKSQLDGFLEGYSA